MFRKCRRRYALPAHGKGLGFCPFATLGGLFCKRWLIPSGGRFGASTILLSIYAGSVRRNIDRLRKRADENNLGTNKKYRNMKTKISINLPVAGLSRSLAF